MAGEAFVRVIGGAVAVCVLMCGVAQGCYAVAFSIGVCEVDHCLLPVFGASGDLVSPVCVTCAVPGAVAVSVPEIATAVVVLFPVVRAEVDGVDAGAVVRVVSVVHPACRHVVASVGV